ncbi:MAG TPA: hypothetical protein VK824_08965 [Planctomycetota bacterium]|nr:hypothetical protein [Planctomycetota bacterium]
MSRYFIEVDEAPAGADGVHVAPWRVHWSAVIVGALVTLAALVVLGLAGVALGGGVLGVSPRDIDDWHRVGWGAVVLTVLGAFFASAAGGWVAGRIAGLRLAEPAMLHGAVVWLVAVPLLIVCAALGARSYMDPWHAGLAGSLPSAAAPFVPSASLSAERGGLTPPTAAEVERTAKVASHGALATLTAVLLGLMGGVIGGWIASGEPMHFAHYRATHLRVPS